MGDSYWYGSDWKAEEPEEMTEEEKRKRCFHKWKSVLLLTSTVYDCEHCGIHKEKMEQGIYDNGKKKGKGIL